MNQTEAAESCLVHDLDRFLSGQWIQYSLSDDLRKNVISQGHFSNLIAEITDSRVHKTYKGCAIEGARLWCSRMSPADGYNHCKYCAELEILVRGRWYMVAPDNMFPDDRVREVIEKRLRYSNRPPSCEIGHTFTLQGQTYRAEAARESTCRGCAFRDPTVACHCSAPKAVPACHDCIFTLVQEGITQ